MNVGVEANDDDGFIKGKKQERIRRMSPVVVY
jgi:hypothetical protein